MFLAAFIQMRFQHHAHNARIARTHLACYISSNYFLCVAAADAVQDPDDVPASEAVRLYQTLERAGRAIAAGKTLLAKRVAASHEWRRQGHGSPAELLAEISGGSLCSARGELETSEALGELPATKRALLHGAG